MGSGAGRATDDTAGGGCKAGSERVRAVGGRETLTVF